MSVKYLHPHIETYIYDQSDVNESSGNTGPRLFMPYLSDKGVDRKIEDFDSLDTFIKEKGKPDFEKHGQPIYQIVNWLNGGGIVTGMRVTAPDAYFAHNLLNVKTKAIAAPTYQKDSDGMYVLNSSGVRIPILDSVTGDPVTVPGVDIKLSIEQIPNLSDKDSLADQIAALPAVDSDGYTNHYILSLCAKGRGEYGNNISWYMNLNTAYEQENTYRLYSFAMYEKQSTGTLKVLEQPYLISTDPSAMNISELKFDIESVFDTYSSALNVVYDKSIYTQLLKDIDNLTKVSGVSTISALKSVDFFFGRDKNNQLYENILINEDGDRLDVVGGLFLAGGSDGVFSMDIASATRKAAINTAFVNVYTGVADINLLDKKRYPFDLTMDANFATVVKNAILSFVTARKDHMAIFDTNIITSAAATLMWAKTVFAPNNYLAAIFGQFFVIYDAFTSKNITVTPLFDLAYRIPYCALKYGSHLPFVGPQRGLLTGFKSIGWLPSEEEKEDLYKARINYIEKTYRNTRYISQLTSQTKTTSLSSINNTMSLFKMISIIEETADDYFFEYPDSATLTAMAEKMNKRISVYIENGQCSECVASVYQTAYDKDHKTVHIKLMTSFNDVMERMIFDVIVTR